MQLAEDKTLAIETKGRKKHPAFSWCRAMPLFLVFPHLLYNSIFISSTQALLHTLFCVSRIVTRTFLCFTGSYCWFLIVLIIFSVRSLRSLLALPESFFTPPYQFFQLIQGFRLRVCQSGNNGIHVKLLVCAQNKRMGNAAFPVVSAQVVSAAG